MAYTTIDDPSAYSQTKLWTGNGGTQSITLDGLNDMQPDWVWIKQRSEVRGHNIQDSVRGATKYIDSRSTGAEATVSNTLTSFDSNGFSVGSYDDVNKSSQTYVSWNWKAGGSASSNSDGSITSSVSASTDAGFSIVSYTGTGSNATVGHGLGAVPKMIITKDRNNSNAWYVYHVGIGNTHGLRLSTTDAKEDDATLWNDTTPTSSVFSVGSNTGTNRSSNPIIAYCFAEKKGYSKFGSYTGNGNANGTFVYLGFKPALVIMKETTDSATNWVTYDNKRNSGNPVNLSLYPNLSNAEGDASLDYDFLSNGFKVRTSNGGINASGQNYIFMAFAENPFVTSSGVPACAR
jgi:hypothetical protein